MDLYQKKRAVGIFLNRIDAERAIGELNRSGFLGDQICVVVNTCDETELGYTGVSDPVRGSSSVEAVTGAFAGGMIGAIVGCLAGLGMLSLPGFGLIVAAGTIGTALSTTCAGAGIGAVGGASIASILAGLEMASDRTRLSSFDCPRSEYLVIVDGTDAQIQLAESLLSGLDSSKVWVC
jgi:hypothetical protein